MGNGRRGSHWPLPCSNAGNNWLLVMQDRYTKWVEIRPLKKATSQAVATNIKEQICLRHGCPRTIVSDKGRQFIGKEARKILSEFNIEHRLTMPYTPQCNPVERANRVIKTMIAEKTEKSQKMWDAHLAELQFAYNTAISSAPGYSPAYLNYGRELRPVGSLAQETALTNPEDKHLRITNLRAALEHARNQMAQSFQRQQAHYNLRRRSWPPEVGSKVLQRTHYLHEWG